MPKDSPYKNELADKIAAEILRIMAEAKDTSDAEIKDVMEKGVTMIMRDVERNCDTKYGCSSSFDCNPSYSCQSFAGLLSEGRKRKL